MENKLKTKPKNIKQILAYYVIFKNRVTFRDFWLPRAWKKYYKTRYYQYPMALNDDAVVLGGRSCGKCFSGNTIIYTNKGREKIKDCVGIKNIMQLNSKLKSDYKKGKVYESGEKECFLLKTNSGRYIEASKDHEFFTWNGWRKLKDIKNNELISISNNWKCLNNKKQIDENWLKILAYLIGNGGLSTGTINFTDFDPIVIKDFYKSFNNIKNTEGLRIVRRKKGQYAISHPKGKPNTFVRRKLQEYGLLYKKSKHKFLPEFIFSLSKKQKIIFLNRLFATDGWVAINKKISRNFVEIGYCSASYKLAEDVSKLLLQFNIFSSICYKKAKCEGKLFDAWTIYIHYRDITKFIKLINVFHRKKECKKVMNIFKQYNRDDSKSTSDIIPYNLVREAVCRQGFTGRQIARLLVGENNPKIRNPRFRMKYNFTKNKAKRINNIIKDKKLENLINADIYWDRVKSIESIGKQKVYDISMLDVDDEFEQNFIANDFIVHNSVDMEGAICQTALTEYNRESLVTAFRKMHIKDRLEKVISFLYNVKYWRKFLLGDANKTLKYAVRRSPTYEIKLKNRHIIYGISTGEDPTAIAIQGTHTHFRYMEEAESYIRDAWTKFQSARDPKFVRDRFTGTVDGRIDSPFFEMDTKISKFKNKRFHLSRRLEPWFDQETKNNLIETFKGEDSNEFKQQCDGEWGEPVWGVWPEKDIIKCLDKKEDPQQPGVFANQITTIILTPKDYTNMSPDQVLWNLPKLPEQDLEVIFGIDGGYSEPTVILPFFYYKNKWNLRCKILLRDKMIADDQAELIDYICDFYNAMIIPIDCTSAEGRSVAQALTNPKRQEYINKKYPERVLQVNFNSTEVIGYTDKDRSFREGEENKAFKEEEIKEKVKNLTTIELYKMFSNHIFDIYYDEDLLGEFNSEVQKKSSSGNYLILTPRNVHIPEAFRCFAMGWWKKYGKVNRPERKSNNYGFVLPEYGDSGISLFDRGKAKQKPFDTGISQ